MEMPPEFETDALANDDDRLRPLRAGAVPPHGDKAAVARGSSADPEQGVHAELSHRLLVENVHLDSELVQRFGAIGEFGGKEDVRRLIDEIARKIDAFGDSKSFLRGRARSRRHDLCR